MGDLRALEFSKWTPAQVAHERYAKVVGGYAGRNLITRLAEGLLEARAETYIIGGGPGRKKLGVGTLIPMATWEMLSADAAHPLWASGEIEIRAYPHGVRFDPIPIKLFGVRFDPVAIDKLAPPEPSAEQPSPAPETPTRIDARKPVSDDHLRAWAETFLKIYDDAYTVKVSDASAAGMFPDKAVSRDKARSILAEVRGTGPRTKGRKATDKG